MKRNNDRFPEDFMFEITNEEKEQLMEVAPRLSILKHSSVSPMVFTEQGVAMLSSVLNSIKSIKLNIEIMRAFSRYRALILVNNELRAEVTTLDRKLTNSFQFLLEKIDALAPAYTNRKRIGFKMPKKIGRKIEKVSQNRRSVKAKPDRKKK